MTVPGGSEAGLRQYGTGPLRPDLSETEEDRETVLFFV